MPLKIAPFLPALLALSSVAASPVAAEGPVGLPYHPVAVRLLAQGGHAPPATAVQPASIPERPLAHPLQAIAGLNRNGEDVFKQPGALPYLVLGVAALASDRQTVKWFRVPEKGEEKSEFAKTFSTVGSGEVIVPAIALMYVVGKGHERDTAKLWAAAIGNATLWTQGIKLLAGKERPNRSEGRIVYHGPGGFRNDSFPSGHTAAAVSSAIVLGHQYPRYKSLFYATALAVGVARIEGRNHWPSDVYWGAGVGYYSGWQAIRNKDAILRWKF